MGSVACHDMAYLACVSRHLWCCNPYVSVPMYPWYGYTLNKNKQEIKCCLVQVLFEAQGRGGKNKSVEMEDIKFHQCVRLARFENDRTISFIPPDGNFDLMCAPTSDSLSCHSQCARTDFSSPMMSKERPSCHLL